MTERRWFTPLGVRGAFRRLLPGEWLRHHDAVASVYAGFAHRIGWLHTERVLTPDKHAEMCAALPEWVADDRTVGDVLTRFGSPSVLLGGTNPRYPRTLLYAADPPRPLLCLHLWNDYDQPVDDGLVLLLAREDASPFGESCWFTPEGRRRRPTDD
ncbi:hypothetical protein U2F26_05695 [Micromonospora sp. 4G57]|uniref:Uncharacterized protein n=1 Tax=Micromonospora sicca TaxID=2202420 RepID=A0ABU5J8X6_9ACTN|nr:MULTISPECIES: hypothetical protein [unclassified Micromonospora]MDZ5442228.1 hypothetical protein [Micromonospora sp. 4G57]MDZ5489033.1 hypothetical protein [Micromonospora sp. 4G53]